jgi:hypothetical protein
MALVALAGCGLATSGMMDDGSTGAGGADASSVGAGGEDASGVQNVDGGSQPGEVSEGGGTSDDATTGNGREGGLEGGGGTDAPITAADACGIPNDGGAVTDILAWPGGPPPKIDGDLSDWPCVGHVDFTDANAAYVKDSAHPLAADVAVRWDSANVYVAMRITDANIGGNDPTDPSNNDSVEVYASGDGTLNGDYDPQTHQYVTDWKGLTVDYGPVHAGQPADVTHAHYVAAAKAGAGSWTFEAALGWQALYAGGGNQYASNTNLALGFEVNDGDGTQQVAALVLMMAPAQSNCTCQQSNCCCGDTPDVPSCDSARITRVTLQ